MEKTIDEKLDAILANQHVAGRDFNTFVGLVIVLLALILWRAW